jgi:hypothetical protein
LGFFENLEPIDGAIESINQLRKQFDVYILTAPSNRNPHCYTEKRLWIEKHFDYEFTERLIISSNKSLLKGDFLIDDYAEGKGQESFGGELIQFGTEKYPDWQAVMEYFEKLQEKKEQALNSLLELQGCLRDMELDRALNFPEFGLEGQVSGLAPVQAEGTIHGNQFYFRHRGSTWQFYVSLNMDIEPHDIELISEGGEEKCANEEGFFTTGVYRETNYDDLERVILKQTQLFNEWFLQKTEEAIIIRDHDTGEIVEKEEPRVELATRIIDNDNPVRYVIASEFSSEWRVFYNVENQCYAQDIEGGTFFKDRKQAEAVASLLGEKVIFKVIKDGDQIKTLKVYR